MNTNPSSPAESSVDCTVVLLIDDQPFVAEVLRRALASEPSLVLHYCSDPAEAIEVANRVRPTVILQDLVMPGIDGLAIVARFRANSATKDTPIIVLSSKEDAHTKSLAFGVGANDYLVKLPEQLELLARVRYHSNACLSRLQRDEAFRALRESRQQLLESNTALMATNHKLGEALSQVKELRGLLPICSYCKRVRRNDGQYWDQIEVYLREHSDLQFSHGVCDTCCKTQMETLAGEVAKANAQAGSAARAGVTTRLEP